MAARLRRSTLFVGALALEALPAALDSGADLVCIDLEDAVPPDRKDEARSAMVVALARLQQLPAAVQLLARVNAVGTHDGEADVDAILERCPAIGALMLPKVEGAADIRAVAHKLEARRPDLELYAIIETTLGLEACADIARADPRLKVLFFGGFDLSTALGCEMAWEPLLYARCRVIHAGALGGVEVIDSPFPNVDDVDGLKTSCERVKALGMTGQAAKHAKQVAAIREAFTPSAAQIDRARRIVAKFRADPTRPLVYEGKLVELPSIRKLERLAALEG